MRSFWKIIFINFYLWRNFITKGVSFFKKLPYIWLTRGAILHFMINHKIMLNRGNKWVQLNVKDIMLYHYLGEFVLTKRIGGIIHNTLKNKRVMTLKKLKLKKKKSGFRLNIIGLRLRYFTSWEDTWFSNYIGYSTILQNVCFIRSLLFWKFRKFCQFNKNLMLSHFNINISSANNFVGINIYVFDRFILYLLPDYIYENFENAHAWGKRFKQLYLKYCRFWCKKVLVMSSTSKFDYWINILKKWNLFIKKKHKFYKRNILLKKNKKYFKMLRSFSFDCRKFLFILTKKHKNLENLFKIVKLNSKKMKRKGIIFRPNIKIFKFFYLRIYYKYIYSYYLCKLKDSLSNCGFLKSEIGFFEITNNGITASFLSRFIGLKLKLKFSLNLIMKGLSGELNRLVRTVKGFYVDVYASKVDYNEEIEQDIILFLKVQCL